MALTKIWVQKPTPTTIVEALQTDIDSLPAVKYEAPDGTLFITVSPHMSVQWQASACGIAIEQYVYVPTLSTYVRYTDVAFNFNDRMIIDSITTVDAYGQPDPNGTDSEFNFWKTHLGLIIADAIQDGIVRRQGW
jgi:hypothetical protein